MPGQRPSKERTISGQRLGKGLTKAQQRFDNRKNTRSMPEKRLYKERTTTSQEMIKARKLLSIWPSLKKERIVPDTFWKAPKDLTQLFIC